MAHRPVTKVQMNSLVPEGIEAYVEELHQTTKIGKSELVHMFVAYFRVNFTEEDIKNMSRDMLVFGEKGLLREVSRVA